MQPLYYKKSFFVSSRVKIHVRIKLQNRNRDASLLYKQISADPLHSNTTLRQKPRPTPLHPHQWAQRAEKWQQGPCTKVHWDPGPLSSIVQKNGEVQEQLLLAAQDIWD